MKVKCKFLVLVLWFLILCSCSRCKSLFDNAARSFLLQEPIYCVSYNAQTFFDAVEDGREFNEFKGPKSKWSAEIYKNRLQRLKQTGELAVETLGGKKNKTPDIFILQEIESIRVVEDFAKLFSKSQGYGNVVFFPPESDQSFSTAVFSKFPIVEYEKFELKDSKFGDYALRPLVKVVLEINLGKSSENLTIFAVHWKSKLGKNTKIIRQAQEKQVLQEAKKIINKDPKANIIICGDFNQELDEFNALAGFGNTWNLETPAMNSTNIRGSYFYKGNWEAIDHIFFSKALNDERGLEIIDFAPIGVQPLLKDNGEPNEFRVFSGNGYSDHLPLCCVLGFLGRN